MGKRDMSDDDCGVLIQDPFERGEEIAREHLGVSFAETLQMLADGKIQKGSILECELEGLRWVIGANRAPSG
jgi:hypothetical protein